MNTDFEHLIDDIQRFLRADSKRAFELCEYAHKFIRSKATYYKFLSSDPFLSTQFLAKTVNKSAKHMRYELVNALDVLLALEGTRQSSDYAVCQRNGYSIVEIQYLKPLNYKDNLALAARA